MFIKKYLKWISTFLVLTGILLTNLNIYPINIYFHGLVLVGVDYSWDLFQKIRLY